MYVDRVGGEACGLFCNLPFSSSLFNNYLFRKRPQDKMCGGDGREPDSSASSPHQHEQRRSPVSTLSVNNFNISLMQNVATSFWPHCLSI